MHALIWRDGPVKDDGCEASVNDMLAAIEEDGVAFAASGRGKQSSENKQHQSRSHGGESAPRQMELGR